MSGISAFREAFVTDGAQENKFESIEARRLRYALYWAMYNNSVYRNVNHWAQSYRNQYGLYRYIRGVYNPSARIGNFWKTAVWGGRLDPRAGPNGAIPIETDNEDLRRAIAQIWTWSNWAQNKDITALKGSIFGDIGLYIRDDVDRGQVYIEVLEPASLADITLDSRGYVKAYTLEETRDLNGKSVIYRETAERESGTQNVIYRTYVDNRPYAWNGNDAEWKTPYGFIPLVLIQHIAVGRDWGLSEYETGRAKIDEANDLASKLHDQIRKIVDPVFLVTGGRLDSQNGSKTSIPGATPTANNPQPGREDVNILTGPAGADVKPFIAPLDIEQTSKEIQNVLRELELDYPELELTRTWLDKSDLSGKALRTARQRTDIKAQDIRGRYDAALVRAQQMAVAIAGWRGLPEFDGFGLDSYAAGVLDHQVADRPVFARDPMDDLEERAEFWNVVTSIQATGGSLEAALLELGWDEQRAKEFVQRGRDDARVDPFGPENEDTSE